MADGQGRALSSGSIPDVSVSLRGNSNTFLGHYPVEMCGRHHIII